LLLDSPQCPDGPRLEIYSYKLDGGHGGRAGTAGLRR